MRLAALLGLLALLSGCVPTTRTLDASDASSRQALGERAGRQQALVTVRGERAVEVRHLRVDADSASWIDDAGALRSVPTADVDRVAFAGADPRGRLDRLEGFALGFVAGTALGTALASTSDDFGMGHPALAVILGLPVGVVGGGAGAAIANGQPERFVLAPRAAPPR